MSISAKFPETVSKKILSRVCTPAEPFPFLHSITAQTLARLGGKHLQKEFSHPMRRCGVGIGVGGDAGVGLHPPCNCEKRIATLLFSPPVRRGGCQLSPPSSLDRAAMWLLAYQQHLSLIEIIPSHGLILISILAR